MSETVLIRLTRLHRGRESRNYFVQCNQADCQYVEANVPPCPLRVSMFAEAIEVADAVRAARRAGY